MLSPIDFSIPVKSSSPPLIEGDIISVSDDIKRPQLGCIVKTNPENGTVSVIVGSGNKYIKKTMSRNFIDRIKDSRLLFSEIRTQLEDEYIQQELDYMTNKAASSNDTITAKYRTKETRKQNIEKQIKPILSERPKRKFSW